MPKDKKMKDYLDYMLIKMLSTKFITTCSIIILSAIFLKDKAITAQIWADLMKVTLLIYAGSNVAQTYVTKNNNGSSDNQE